MSPRQTAHSGVVDVTRHRLFDITTIIRRTALYTILLVCLGAMYAGMSGLGVVLIQGLAPQATSLSVPGFLAALVVAVTFQPIQRHLRRWVDRLFLGEQVDVLGLLAKPEQLMPRSPAEVAAAMVDLAVRAMGPAWAYISLDDHVLAGVGPIPEGRIPPDALSLPLPGVGMGSAYLVLGPRRNDMPYGGRDRKLLHALAVHTAVLLETARLQAEQAELAVQEGTVRALAEARRSTLMQILHDLRSDLWNIALAADRVHRNPTVLRPLESMRRSLTRIETFLVDKAQGRGTDAPDRTSLVQVVHTGLGVLTERLAQGAVRLDVQVPDHPAWVPLSAIAAEQVIINLVDNALKFSPRGSCIHLSVSTTDRGTQLIVADEGPGIPSELLGHLGTGRRGDPTKPGSGLGLRNVKGIVEAAGGRLSWCNGLRGAIVEVRVPVVSDETGLVEHDQSLGAT